MQELLTLKYQGEGVSEGEMDAYEVAAAVRGFSDFTRLIGAASYGEDAEIKTTIRGFREGTFEIDLVYNLVSPEFGGLISSTIGSPGDFLKLIRDCFDLIKHLRGKPPRHTRRAEPGIVNIENNHGVVIQADELVVNVVLDRKTGRAVQDFVKRPLARSADKIDIVSKHETVATAGRDDSEFFTEIETSEKLAEHTVEVFLDIRTAVLEGETKWRFHDGQRIITATIEDQAFLLRVAQGERFGKGDTLRVRLRATQRRIGGQLKADYVIEEILDHAVFEDRQNRLL